MPELDKSSSRLVVVVEPRLASEFQADELDDLVASIRSALLSDVTVYEQEPSRLPGITFWQQMYIFVATGAAAAAAGKVTARVVDRISDEAIDRLIEVSVSWARRWFAKKPNPMKRPRYVAIYDEHGEIIRSVLVKVDDDEPEDRTNDPLNSRRMPPPSLGGRNP